jgi:hypothetical protein
LAYCRPSIGGGLSSPRWDHVITETKSVVG